MIPIAFLTPHEQRNQAGPIAITKTGAVREVPFDGGEGWFVEEGTTNLVPNPCAAVSATHWVGGSNRTYSRIDSLPSPLPGSDLASIETGLRAVSTIGHSGTSLITGATDTPVSPSTTYTTQFSVWIEEGSEITGLQIRIAELIGGSALHLSTPISVSGGSWHRLFFTFTTGSDITVIRTQVMAVGSWRASEAIIVTAAQLEAKPYATSFAHGDMGTGYSWQGTPHQSASVRAVGRLSFDVPSNISSHGSAYVRYRPHNARQGNGYLIGYGTDHGHLSRDFTAMTRARVLWSRTGASSDQFVPGPPDESGIVNIYGGWSETQLMSKVNGNATIVLDRTPPPIGVNSEVWDVGHAIGTQNSNSIITCAILFDHPLTEAEIARLDAIPTSELTWANVARPEMRVKVDGEIIRAAGYKAKYSGLLKDVKIGRIEDIARPTLLLRPGASADRNGPVVPTVGANVQIVEGQYGDAWSVTSGSGGRVSIPISSYMPAGMHTIFVRASWQGDPSGNQYVINSNNTTGILIGRVGTGELRFFYNGNLAWGYHLAPDTYYVFVARVGGGLSQKALFNGVTLGERIPAIIPSLAQNLIIGESSSPVFAESVLIYDRALPDTEIARISNMPTAWTMQNAAAYLG